MKNKSVKLSNNNSILQVLKFEDEYYEVGSVVSVVYETFMSKPIIGRIVEFNKQTGCGVTLSETVTLDTSDLYKSCSQTLYVSYIKDMELIQ